MVIAVLGLCAWFVCILIVLLGWRNVFYAEEVMLGEKFLIMLLALIGAPFLIIGNLIEATLDTLLPPGWDDEGEL
jgi:hypothetical protein